MGTHIDSGIRNGELQRALVGARLRTSRGAHRPETLGRHAISVKAIRWRYVADDFLRPKKVRA